MNQQHAPAGTTPTATTPPTTHPSPDDATRGLEYLPAEMEDQHGEQLNREHAAGHYAAEQ